MNLLAEASLICPGAVQDFLFYRFIFDDGRRYMVQQILKFTCAICGMKCCDILVSLHPASCLS